MASRQYTIDIGETPSVTVPADTVDPATNRADLAKAKIRVRYPGEPADVMEVTNWTGNLQNSAEQHRFYRREFCTLAGLSPALGGEAEGSGGESGYARRLGMVPTEAEAGSRQECWDAAFGEVVEVARQLLRVYGGRSDFPAEALVVSTAWPATIPEDAQEASTTATQEHRQGVRSTRSAIERLNPDWDAERVDAEEAAIRQEREEAAAPARVALPGG